MGAPTGPEVHLHARVLPVFRSREVGVVDSTAILRFRVDRILAAATLPEVVFLEVARRLGETVPVQLVMDHIVEEEQILYGDLAIIRRRRRDGEIDRGREAAI